MIDPLKALQQHTLLQFNSQMQVEIPDNIFVYALIGLAFVLMYNHIQDERKKLKKIKKEVKRLEENQKNMAIGVHYRFQAIMRDVDDVHRRNDEIRNRMDQQNPLVDIVGAIAGAILRPMAGPAAVAAAMSGQQRRLRR